MTKQLRFLMLTLFALICGGVYAQDKSVTSTLGATAEKCTSTGDGTVTWKYSRVPTTTTQPANGMYWATKPTTNDVLTASLSEANAIITSVTVQGYTNSGTGKTVEVKVGGEAFGEVITFTKSPATYTVNGSASGEVELFLKSTSTEKSHIIKTVTITYTVSDKTATQLTFAELGSMGG